jgi:hypothetical protein
MYFGHRVGSAIPGEFNPVRQHFSDSSIIVPTRRVARDARAQRRVDRNVFRSPRGKRDSGRVQPCPPAFLRFIDHCSCPPCRARRPRPAECRPKCISVIAWEAVDRNVFRSPRGKRDSGRVQPCPKGSTFVRTAITCVLFNARRSVPHPPCKCNDRLSICRAG